MRSLVRSPVIAAVIAAPILLVGLAPATAQTQGQPLPPAAQAPDGPAAASPGDSIRLLGIGFGVVAGALAFTALNRALGPALPVVTGATAARSFALGADYGFQSGQWHGAGVVLAALGGGAIGNWLYKK